MRLEPFGKFTMRYARASWHRPYGGKEGLGEMMNKYPNWFSPNLHEFWGQTDKLPFDAHWYLALCAPRPFIAPDRSG